MDYRTLLMRSNRFIGSALVDKNLIKLEDLEEANQRLLDIVREGNLKQASILNVLLFELKALEEKEMLTHLANNSFGLIDLTNYDLENAVDPKLDLELCWTTWTIPFDKVDGVHFLASAYCMSDPARRYWEEKLDGAVEWFASSVNIISDGLERLEQHHMLSLDEGAEEEGGDTKPKKLEA